MKRIIAIAAILGTLGLGTVASSARSAEPPSTPQPAIGWGIGEALDAPVVGATLAGALGSVGAFEGFVWGSRIGRLGGIVGMAAGGALGAL